MGTGKVSTMKWIYIAFVTVLSVVFLRADIRLWDLLWNANMLWSSAIALFLFGILLGQWLAGRKAHGSSARWAFWGSFTVILLGLVEYSVEWRDQTLVPRDKTVLLAANVESVTQYYISAEDGLFRTDALLNGQKVRTLVDTGASLVLLNNETAKSVGIDTAALRYDHPVVTASAPMRIARVKLREVRVGPIVLRDVDAAVSPPGTVHSNLLGASFLSRLDAATFRGRTAILQQTNQSYSPVNPLKATRRVSFPLPAETTQ